MGERGEFCSEYLFVSFFFFFLIFFVYSFYDPDDVLVFVIFVRIKGREMKVFSTTTVCSV